MMQVPSSMSLVEWPEEFSETYSVPPFMRPWVQGQLTEEVGEARLTDSQRQVLRRILGMALVWYMPNVGLEETLDVLSDTFHFYVDEPQLSLTEPEQTFTVSLLPSTEPPSIYLAEP